MQSCVILIKLKTMTNKVHHKFCRTPKHAKKLKRKKLEEPGQLFMNLVVRFWLVTTQTNGVTMLDIIFAFQKPLNLFI